MEKVEDFDVFGDDGGGSNHEEPPEIIIKDTGAMSYLEINAHVEKVENLCKRAVSCLKTAIRSEKESVDNVSWAAYLLEKSLICVRELGNEIIPGKEVQDRRKHGDYMIDIKIEEGYILMDFPVLMPKRNQNLKTCYYTDSVDRALKNIKIPTEYCEENVTIIFLHCYKYDHAKWAKKDHDNIEIKWIIDALNNHFFIDDGPFRTSLYNHSTIDTEDHTVIYLVPMSKIGEFLKTHIILWEKQKVRYQKQG